MAWADLDRAVEPDHLTVGVRARWPPRRWRPSWCASTSWCARCGPSARGTGSRPTRASPATCSRRPTRSLDAIEPAATDEPPRGGARRPAVPGRASTPPSPRERGAFTLADVARGIHDKLARPPPARVRRRAWPRPPTTVAGNWEAIKRPRRGGSRSSTASRRACRPCSTPPRSCRRPSRWASRPAPTTAASSAALLALVTEGEGRGRRPRVSAASRRQPPRRASQGRRGRRVARSAQPSVLHFVPHH